jgi:hypothetical protein
MVVPHDSQLDRLGPFGKRLFARFTASVTVASI